MPVRRPLLETAARPLRVVSEAATWRSVGKGWKQLFGDFQRLGDSFEWHEFEAVRDFDWAPSFHPGSVELCLNLAGAGQVVAGDAIARFSAATAGFYRQAQTVLEAFRAGGETHRFITVELAPTFLGRHLTGAQDLHPLVADAVSGTNDHSGVSEPTPLSSRLIELVESLRHPPVLASAQTLWYQAKAVELMGEFFFHPTANAELFCHRQQRVARNRVDAVRAVLRRDLAKTPPLEELAREVGCSSFYLSRTFGKETGQTIPQYLRQLRLERAAELLKTGNYNVTEAAIEVGYNSLSHFSHAFHQAYGCCPGLYPMQLLDKKR